MSSPADRLHPRPLARTPELILVNGDIHTMEAGAPRARAVAIGGGRILAVGGDAAMRDLAGPGTQVIDLGGRLVLPGFQDTHIHLQDSGHGFWRSVNLEGAERVDELQVLLSDHAGRTTDREWVLGTGWYSGLFGAHNLTRQVLDQAVPDRPVFILASDGHNAAVNTVAMERVGLTADTPHPFNGHFVHDDQGQPTGLLYETAVHWVRDRMPPPTDQDWAEGVRYGQAHANRHGITGVLDALVEERHLRVYQHLADHDQLTLRVAATALVEPEDSVEQALERTLGFRRRHYGPMLKVHSAKFFLDGVIENRTAAMIAPYSDATGGNAPLMFTPEQIHDHFVAFDAARFQIHVHAIGDMAVRAALDGMEAARRANGVWPSLHQIAHIQCIDPADIPRFVALGVMGNVQTLWARNDASVADVAVPMVGPERARWMYAFGSLRDAGVRLALSSDWGVSSLNPFHIMYTAIERLPAEPRRNMDVFVPDERLTLAEAVEGYTLNAADAAWRGDRTGRLTRGHEADLVVLDRDIFAVSSKEMADTQVLMTMVGGRAVWTAPEFSA